MASEESDSTHDAQVSLAHHSEASCRLLETLPLPYLASPEATLEPELHEGLWRTLFALIVELGIRSGLFTAEELMPPMGMVSPFCGSPGDEHVHERHEEAPFEKEDASQELAEESGREDDPIVDLVMEEPEAEADRVIARGSEQQYRNAQAWGVEPAEMNEPGVGLLDAIAPAIDSGEEIPDGSR